MGQAIIKVNGMSCMHCVGRVKKAVEGIAGITKSDVQVGVVDVSFDDSKTSQSAIEAAIEKSGYKINKG